VGRGTGGIGFTGPAGHSFCELRLLSADSPGFASEGRKTQIRKGGRKRCDGAR